MKLAIFKYMMPAALSLAISAGMSSCSDDLNQGPIDPHATAKFDKQEVAAKIYGLMALSGQKGPTGNADINDDEGRNPFFRRIFEANEFSTDECLWVWQSDPGVGEFTSFSWSPAHVPTEMMYNRIGYNVTQCNNFLDIVSGDTDAESVRLCAEVRFFRAMYYQYYLDLFRKAPFKEHFNTALPVEKGGEELFNYIEGEYLAILNDLDDPQPNAETFGRVNRAAAWMMLARLYLNAEVYTGKPRWEDARTYAGKVIEESGYELSKVEKNGYTGYQQLFMADNDENAEAMKEIILPIRQDGLHTQTYGGTWYLVSSLYSANMTNFYGTNDAWGCIRARAALVDQFFKNREDVPLTENPKDIRDAANDDRALFYGGASDGTQRTVETEKLTTFQSGLSVIKWVNKRCDGAATHDVKIPDTDIPFLRLAEAYLTRAEANFRLSAPNATVAEDVNQLRRRAHAKEWAALDVTEANLLGEWSREFYLEGRRRTDLVRFDAFTTNKYLWDWKGGVYEGIAVNSMYNVYSIPEAELNNNPHMSQNPEY